MAEQKSLEETDFIDLNEDDLEDDRMDAYLTKLEADRQNSPGRQSKLTRQTYEAIIKYVKAGCYITHAAGAVGIEPKTLYDWMKKGQDEPNSVYGAFREEMLKAYHSATLAHELNIKNAATQGDVKASQWWLSKMHPDIYGKESKVKVEMSGPDGLPIQIEDKGQKSMMIPATELRKMLQYEEFVDQINALPPANEEYNPDDVQDIDYTKLEDEDEEEKD